MRMSERQENWLFGLGMVLALVAGGMAGQYFTWEFILIYSFVIGSVVGNIYGAELGAAWNYTQRHGVWRVALASVLFVFVIASWSSRVLGRATQDGWPTISVFR